MRSSKAPRQTFAADITWSDEFLSDSIRVSESGPCHLDEKGGSTITCLAVHPTAASCQRGRAIEEIKPVSGDTDMLMSKEVEPTCTSLDTACEQVLSGQKSGLVAMIAHRPARHLAPVPTEKVSAPRKVEVTFESTSSDDSDFDAYVGGEDPESSDGEFSEEDPDFAVILGGWKEWESPCSCMASRRGLCCSSARCVNALFGEQSCDSFGALAVSDSEVSDNGCICSEVCRMSCCSSDYCVNCPPRATASSPDIAFTSLSSQGLREHCSVSRTCCSSSACAFLGAAQTVADLMENTVAIPVVKPKVSFAKSLEGVVNKRRRTRERQKSAAREKSYDASPCNRDLLGAPCIPKPSYSAKELMIAEAHYEAFHQFPPGAHATADQVALSSAGVASWLAHDPDSLHKVGDQVCSPVLCGLWVRQALSAVADLLEWERIFLTVDSGASDTVIPPTVAANLPLLHSSRVGTEYEVANGGVVVNLGERKGEVITRMGAATSFLMNFQVVKVHKPLLAVSRLVEAGHKVSFDKSNCHILLSTGERVPMRCTGGTYEVELWIRNPGFTRQTER